MNVKNKLWHRFVCLFALFGLSSSYHIAFGRDIYAGGTVFISSTYTPLYALDGRVGSVDHLFIAVCATASEQAPVICGVEDHSGHGLPWTIEPFTGSKAPAQGENTCPTSTVVKLTLSTNYVNSGATIDHTTVPYTLRLLLRGDGPVSAIRDTSMKLILTTDRVIQTPGSTTVSPPRPTLHLPAALTPSSLTPLPAVVACPDHPPADVYTVQAAGAGAGAEVVVGVLADDGVNITPRLSAVKCAQGARLYMRGRLEATTTFRVNIPRSAQRQAAAELAEFILLVPAHSSTVPLICVIFGLFIMLLCSIILAVGSWPWSLKVTTTHHYQTLDTYQT